MHNDDHCSRGVYTSDERCKYTFTQNGVRGRPTTTTSVFSERHGRWSSPGNSHSGRVCRCCDGCAPFTGPVVSGRRVNWFTEKTISALVYFKRPLTRNDWSSSGRVPAGILNSGLNLDRSLYLMAYTYRYASGSDQPYVHDAVFDESIGGPILAVVLWERGRGHISH